MRTATLIELGRRFFGRPEQPTPEDVAEVEAEQEDGALFNPEVMRTLAAAQSFERPGADENRPRVLISIPGSMPFDAKDDVPAALQRRFPGKLVDSVQAETAARFLRQVLRERRRQQRGPSFVNNW